MSVVWGRIVVGGQDMGAGIVLAARSLLTTARCVRDVAVGAVDADLTVVIGDASPTTAVLRERVDAADLALLTLTDRVCATTRLPLASRCHPGDRWLAPARPDGSPLVGEVAGAMADVPSPAGGLIRAIRLSVPADPDVRSADGPVFDGNDRVIGLLAQPSPERTQTSEPGTLFAAAIEGAIDQFESLRSSYLLRVLVCGADATPATVPKPRDADAIDTILRLLDRQGVIDPEVRAIHQVLAGKWATDDHTPDEQREALS